MVAIDAVRANEEQWKGWEEEGYVVVEGAVSGESLARLQSAFDRGVEASKAAWLEDVAVGHRSSSYFDLPNAFQQDDIFLDMVDNPNTLGLLRDFLGEDMIARGLTARSVPPCPISYVGWHPDMHRDRHPQHIKVQVYVNDVAEERGAFAYVPGSHKEGAGPYPRVKHLDAMPGHRVLPGKAGTAVIFNTYGWHTSMINRTLEPRKSLIMSYCVFHELNDRWSQAPERKRARAEMRAKLSPEPQYLFGHDRGDGTGKGQKAEGRGRAEDKKR